MEDLRTLLPRGSILIVDDSTEWRAIVREILKAQPGLQLVAEACDGLDAVYKATKLRPDLVLLDIGTPVMNGLDAADTIRQVSPRSRIVFLTQEDDAGFIFNTYPCAPAPSAASRMSASQLLSTIAAVLRNGHHPLSAYVFPV